MNTQPKRYRSSIVADIMSNRNAAYYQATKRSMLIATRIDDALNAKGWTKKQLADLMHKNPSEVTKWLSGTHNFTLETLYLIESFLEIMLFEIPTTEVEYA